MTISKELRERLITFLEEVEEDNFYQANYCIDSCSCDNLRMKCSDCAAPYKAKSKEAQELIALLEVEEDD